MPKPAANATRLVCAASSEDADLLYTTRHYLDDPFVWWETRGETHALLSDLEIDRARGVMQVNQLHAIADYLPAAARDQGFAAQISAVASRDRIKSFLVPPTFPAGLLEDLRRRELLVNVSPLPFFPQRQIKTEAEVKSLRAALRVAEIGLARGLEVLRASEPDAKGFLRWAGSALTSERLRAEIDCAVLQAGGTPRQTIVAGGLQGCDPHERGHGPLRAHEAIVLDIFPRHSQNHFFGDLTRTVVRGQASEALRRQYTQVQEEKKWTLRQMRDGADGPAIQKELLARFAAAGYPKEQRAGRWVGMFHGTGHGLGLELHEAPRFAAGPLFTGQCITVEPGLYFPGVGGVRLEDVVVVGATGVRNLTRSEERLEI